MGFEENDVLIEEYENLSEKKMIIPEDASDSQESIEKCCQNQVTIQECTSAIKTIKDYFMLDENFDLAAIEKIENLSNIVHKKKITGSLDKWVMKK